jgi:hypothetical protein
MKNVLIYYSPGHYDAYTAVMPSGEMYGFSEYPYGPLSYNNYVGEYRTGLKLGKKVNFNELNNELQKAITNRYETSNIQN